jgi:ATP-dependent helicase/nuclease subunit A
MEACGFTKCLPGNQRIEEYLQNPRENLGKAFWSKGSLAEISKKAGEFGARDLRKLEKLFSGVKAAAADYLQSHARARIYPYLLTLVELRKEVRVLAESKGELLGGAWLDRTYEYLHENQVPGEYAFLKLGSVVRHFLIDEFQDTSRRQWETLTVLIDECLASGGTLFYVGDVKQAIYGWRGGDWRLFGEVMREDFPSVEPGRRAEKVLETNYRSLPAIVEFNNTLYSTLVDPALGRELAAHMMPSKTTAETCEELAATLAANFADVVQKVRPSLPEGAGEGFVCALDIWGDAETIAAGVEGWLRRQVKEVWQERKKGIAVLVRSNRQAEAVATWLIAEGVPIVTENSLRLRSSPLVKGLVSFLHFLEYPLDDLAFWGALASPLFKGLVTPGESLEAFLTGGRWPRPLYRAFERAFPEESRHLVRTILARSGFLTPYDLVREVLATFDVERRFPDQAVFTNRFLEIVFQAEARRSLSLSGFLEFWDETGAEEQVGLPEDLSAVRILTIHKAKGLEFPVVFVPFTNWKRRHDKEGFTSDGGLVWLESSGGVPLPPELAEQRLRSTMKDVIENLNLLYVATTRPTDALYLYVTCPMQRDTPNRQYLSAWLARMMDAAHLDRLEGRP